VWVEVRIGSDGLVTPSTPGASAAGIGNVQIGAKLRLWAEAGGVPVLSILPTMNLPVASAEKGLGSGSADYTVALLTGRDFGRHIHPDVNYGAGPIAAPHGQPPLLHPLAS